MLKSTKANREYGQQAANIIYAFYVDELVEGRMYHMSELMCTTNEAIV